MLGAGALGSAAASARPPERLQLASDSTCPSAAHVARELAPLLPRTRLDVAIGAAGAAPRAEILDEGDAVRIRIGEEERSFDDPKRICSERARASAVFIGLVLDPPVLPEAQKPPPAPAPLPPPEPPSPAGSERGPDLTLELGPLLQIAPISDAAQLPLAGGFGGRLAWGRGLSLVLGAAFLLPTRLALPEADARLVWLPFDLAVRGSHDADPLTLSAELGPELALLFASGDRVENPRTSTRLEVGARGALSVTWHMSARLGAFLSVHSVWRPRPYDFRVNPNLASGTTPPLWIGTSLGLSLRAR